MLFCVHAFRSLVPHAGLLPERTVFFRAASMCITLFRFVQSDTTKDLSLEQMAAALDISASSLATLPARVARTLPTKDAEESTTPSMVYRPNPARALVSMPSSVAQRRQHDPP